MLILIDRKMPAAAKKKLAGFGEVIEFATEGITYEAISGHPDIFFCPTPAGLIVAPNLPQKYFTILNQNNIQFTIGQLPVGKNYPESARYNTLVTQKYIFQNSSHCDAAIRKLNPDPEIVDVNQGYVRCNLVSLPNGSFFTSDHGIEKSLKKRGLDVLYIDPSGVKLHGFDHGFFGGACGLSGNTLLLCGSLEYFKEKERILAFCAGADVKVIELYDGEPVDVGTILFLKV